ncbi:MAG: hypothetical protein M1837_006915 [Sclerophora amabilis]|nr:MAG: hypothetical protein M1837_006915 [Sclerophora amabilis]
MPPNSNSYTFTGGVSAAKAKNMSLPTKIVCRLCTRPREKHMFSQRQLNELAFKVSHSGPAAMNRPTIQCRLCTGGQVTELACSMCSVVKSLNSFSKAQRRDPDRARCIACVKVHERTEPGVKPADEDLFAQASDGDEDDDDDDDDVSNVFEDDTISRGYMPHSDEGTLHSRDLLSTNLTSHDYSDTQSLASHEPTGLGTAESSTMGGVRFPGPASTIEPASVASESLRFGSEYDEGGWVSQPRRRRKSVRKNAIPFTAYDAEGVAHSRFKTPTVASGDYTVGPRAPPLPKGRRESRWAKVKASSNKPPGRDIYAESEDDSDDPEGKDQALALSDDDDDDDEYTIAEW